MYISRPVINIIVTSGQRIVMKDCIPILSPLVAANRFVRPTPHLMYDFLAHVNCSCLTCMEDHSSGRTKKDPSNDRNRNRRQTGGIPTTRKGTKFPGLATSGRHESQNTDAQGTRAPATTLFISNKRQLSKLTSRAMAKYRLRSEYGISSRRQHFYFGDIRIPLLRRLVQFPYKPRIAYAPKTTLIIQPF